VTLKNKELFHSQEVLFCGYSGSGKTTLISKLINGMSNKLDIGYVKHDAHNFEIDHEGKDTWVAKDSGAKYICISSLSQHASIQVNPFDNKVSKTSLADMDVVFVEGHKKSTGRKIIVLGEGECEKNILEDYQNGLLENVLAFVGVREYCPVKNIRYFKRDQIGEIGNFLYTVWQNEMALRPLYGLVLGGGISSRMGRDKGSLQYYGKNQLEHLYDLLGLHTDRAFVSCRSEQKGNLDNLNYIEDRFLGFGPSGGILSAMDSYPQVSWLVLACDLPFIDSETIEYLKLGRNPYKVATCYESSKNSLPEPLCAIYEPKSKMKLGKYLIEGHPCPRKVLINSNVKKLKLDKENALDNINTPEQYKKALNEIKLQEGRI